MFHKILVIVILLVLLTYTESEFTGDDKSNSWCSKAHKLKPNITETLDTTFLCRLVRISDTCLGTMLGPLNVLTSAMCVNRFGSIEDMHAYVGPVFRDADAVPVWQMVVHPKYEDGKHHYNLAVVKLKRKPREEYKIICIPQQCHLFEKKDFMVLAAWDRTNSDPHKNTMYLRCCMLSDTECNALKSMKEDKLKGNETCVQPIRDNGQLCKANNGGPLLVYYSYGERLQQIGIVSQQDLCKKGPTITTNVCGDNYYWIARVAHGVIRNDVVIEKVQNRIKKVNSKGKKIKRNLK